MVQRKLKLDFNSFSKQSKRPILASIIFAGLMPPESAWPSLVL